MAEISVCVLLQIPATSSSTPSDILTGHVFTNELAAFVFPKINTKTVDKLPWSPEIFFNALVSFCQANDVKDWRLLVPVTEEEHNASPFKTKLEEVIYLFSPTHRPMGN